MAPTEEIAMTVTTVPHLNFRGEAQAALEYYASLVGGQAMIATYADFGMPRDLPGASDVVFGQVVGAGGFSVMAYDVPGAEHAPGLVGIDGQASTRRENGVTMTNEPFFLSVRGEELADVEPLWAKLAADARAIVAPFGPSPWAPAFGMLTDRFGITWILDVAASYAG